MRYLSTRQSDQTETVSATEAFLKGQPEDGGLWVPEGFPLIDHSTLQRMSSWPLSRRYAHILHLFLEEIPVAELERICIGLIPDSKLIPSWSASAAERGDDSARTEAYYSRSGVQQMNPYNSQLFLLDMTAGPTASAEDLIVGLIPRITGLIRRSDGADAGNTDALRFIAGPAPAQVTAASVAFAAACEEGYLTDEDSLTAVYAADLASAGRSGLQKPTEQQENREEHSVPETEEVPVEALDPDEEHARMIDRIIDMLANDDAAGVRLQPESEERVKQFEEAWIAPSTALLSRPLLPVSIEGRITSGQMRFMPVGGFTDQVQRILRQVQALTLTADSQHEFTSLDERHPVAMILAVAHIISAYCDLLTDEQVREEDTLTFVVPSSHMTLYLAVAYAAQMGLPLRTVVAAGAQNTAITEFFRNGRLNIRKNGFHNVDLDALDIELGDDFEPGARRRVNAGEKQAGSSEARPRKSGGGQQSSKQRNRRRRKPSSGQNKGAEGSPEAQGRKQQPAQSSKGRGGSARSSQRRRSDSGRRGGSRRERTSVRATAALTPNFEAVLPTNLERLMFELTGRQGDMIAGWWKNLEEKGELRVDSDLMREVKRIFQSGYADEREITDAMRDAYNEFDIPLDPHSAAGYAVYQRLEGKKADGPVIFLQTHDAFISARPMIETLFGKKFIRRLNRFKAQQILAEEFGVNVPAIAASNSLVDSPAVPLDELPARLLDIGEPTETTDREDPDDEHWDSGEQEDEE